MIRGVARTSSVYLTYTKQAAKDPKNGVTNSTNYARTIPDTSIDWSEQNFEDFLQTRFPRVALEASIPILWRYLHFHAYFPFPQQSCQQIDCEAFQRAVVLLASDGSVRLGYSSIGIEIDADRDGALNSQWRMFRSLAIPSLTKVVSKTTPSEKDVPQWSQIDDLLDVLDLVQPPRVPYGPTWREDFRPHASRILRGSEFYTYSSIPRLELLGLLTLLLNISLICQIQV